MYIFSNYSYVGYLLYNYRWLVVSTPLINMSSSVGTILPNWMESHNPFMFQSTNQIITDEC